jgi:hypothetical protein
MKIIISVDTVVQTNAIANAELGQEIAMVFSEKFRKMNVPTAEETIEGMDQIIAHTKDNENVTITRDDKEITIEINDEIFFMFTNTYIRVMKIMLPMVATFKQIFGLAKCDMHDIMRFATKKKQK